MKKSLMMILKPVIMMALVVIFCKFRPLMLLGLGGITVFNTVQLTRKFLIKKKPDIDAAKNKFWEKIKPMFVQL